MSIFIHVWRIRHKSVKWGILTVEVRHFGQHHAGCGHAQPVVQLEGAGREFDGVRGVVVMRAVRVRVGQSGVLAGEGSGRVRVHGMTVQSLRRDARGALRM